MFIPRYFPRVQLLRIFNIGIIPKYISLSISTAKKKMQLRTTGHTGGGGGGVEGGIYQQEEVRVFLFYWVFLFFL